MLKALMAVAMLPMLPAVRRPTKGSPHTPTQSTVQPSPQPQAQAASQPQRRRRPLRVLALAVPRLLGQVVGGSKVSVCCSFRLLGKGLVG